MPGRVSPRDAALVARTPARGTRRPCAVRGSRGRAARTVAAAASVSLGVALVACSPGAALDVLSAYRMVSGTHTYAMKVTGDGVVRMPPAIAKARKSPAEQPLAVDMTASVARKVSTSGDTTTIETTFSDLAGTVTSSGQTMDLGAAGGAVSGKTFTVTVSPKGTSVGSGAQQLNVPGARIDGNGCPTLPSGQVKPGATWKSTAALPGIVSVDLETQNRYVGVETVGGRKVAKISSTLQGPVDASVDMSKLSGLGGGGQAAQMLAGMQVRLTGTVDLTTTCTWALEDDLLVSSESKGSIDVTMNASGGPRPEMAQMISGTGVRQNIASSLTLRN